MNNDTALIEIRSLQQHSLAMLVQREIERLILSGEYLPGDKLPEQALAERLGVSRGPIREAFRSLEESGLVRVEKNRGVFVRHIELDEAVEIYEIRAALDRWIGYTLAARIGPEQVAVLRALLDGMDCATAARDADTYHLLNLDFHDRLVEFTGNQKLILTYRRLVNELALFRKRNLGNGGSQLPASNEEHHRILDAITSGDPEAAGKRLFEHVLRSRDRTIALNRPG